jgi:hypothetical protein
MNAPCRVKEVAQRGIHDACGRIVRAGPSAHREIVHVYEQFDDSGGEVFAELDSVIGEPDFGR